MLHLEFHQNQQDPTDELTHARHNFNQMKNSEKFMPKSENEPNENVNHNQDKIPSNNSDDKIDGITIVQSRQKTSHAFQKNVPEASKKDDQTNNPSTTKENLSNKPK